MLRKMIFITILLPVLLEAQIFGTGQTLRKGSMSIGLNPALYQFDGKDDLYFFLHGGYGLRRGLDLGVKLGLLGDETYIGADLEFNLHKKYPFISFSTGVHHFFDVGLDETLNFTYPIGKGLDLYSGFDMDIEFVESEATTPMWFFIGFEINVKRRMDLLFEVEIDVNNEAWSIISGGLNFYL